MTKREYDNNGFFEVKNNPLSKEGIFEYLGSSIGAEDPNKIYKVYRPKEELSNEETLNSFKLMPLVDNHTMLGAGETPVEDKNAHGVIGEDVYFENGILFGNLKIWSEKLKSLIEEGKRELSCGYKCTYDFIQGIYNGESYDVIQKNIRGNHIALVDEGRMGSEVAVLDNKESFNFREIFTFDTKDIIKMEKVEKKVEDTEVVKKAEDVEEPLTIAMVKKIVEEAIKAESEKKTEKKTEDEEIEKKEEKKVEDEEIGQEKKGMDANEIRSSILNEIRQKDILANKLSNVVGSFDHSDKSLEDVVSYGMDKLKLSCDKGQELPTLNGYLAGVSIPKSGMDSINIQPNISLVDKYLTKGE